MDVLPIIPAEVLAPSDNPTTSGFRAHLSAVYALTQTLLSRIKSPAVWPGFFLFGM